MFWYTPEEFQNFRKSGPPAVSGHVSPRCCSRYETVPILCSTWPKTSTSLTDDYTPSRRRLASFSSQACKRNRNVSGRLSAKVWLESAFFRAPSRTRLPGKFFHFQLARCRTHVGCFSVLVQLGPIGLAGFVSCRERNWKTARFRINYDICFCPPSSPVT